MTDNKMTDHNKAEHTKKAGCPYAKLCGGCQYSSMPYEEQLKNKQKQASKLFKEFGKVLPILGMKDPLYYRNKVHHVFDRDRKGNIISGCYEANSHRVVAIGNCMIEDKISQSIILSIEKLAKAFKIKIYNEDTEFGLLRHVLIRRGFSAGEIMVVLVLASPILPGKNNFVKALRKEHPEITTIVLNVNEKPTNMVLGDRNITLFGPGFIKDRLCGNTYRISPASFYQVNPVQTEILYQTAIDYAGLTGKETVIDAYCGIGTIGLTAAKDCGKVIGVELNPDAVKDARVNAKENNIKNASFFKGDAGDFMIKMAAQGQKADVVFMDPPRSGSTKSFMDAVFKIKPQKVVYVSCGPDTLQRDLRYFVKHGYRVEKIQPVDLFPLTSHVETCCLLVKEYAHDDELVSIKVDLEGISLDQGEYVPEEKPTYGNIKKWIKAKYGFNVTNLYIGQVKDKAGIKERKNYNIGSGEGRVPNCPKEKEEAIMDAFRYYNLI